MQKRTIYHQVRLPKAQQRLVYFFVNTMYFHSFNTKITNFHDTFCMFFCLIQKNFIRAKTKSPISKRDKSIRSPQLTRTRSRAQGQYGQIYAQHIHNSQHTDVTTIDDTLQSARTTLIHKPLQQNIQNSNTQSKSNKFSPNQGSLIKKSQLGRTLFGS